MYTEPLEETQQDLFTESDLNEYEPASNGQRFLNYLIDILFVRYALSYVFGYAIGYLLVAISGDFYIDIVSDTNSVSFWIFTYFLGAIIFIVYYTSCEKFFKGYSLGKIITGTKAVREDGRELSFKDALLRSLSRIVPFEPLSIWFDNGLWHDRWTKTVVIKAR